MDTDTRFKPAPVTRYTDRHQAARDALREYETTMTRKGTPVTVAEYDHCRRGVLKALRAVVEQIEEDEAMFIREDGEEE